MEIILKIIKKSIILYFLLFCAIPFTPINGMKRKSAMMLRYQQKKYLEQKKREQYKKNQLYVGTIKAQTEYAPMEWGPHATLFVLQQFSCKRHKDLTPYHIRSKKITRGNRHASHTIRSGMPRNELKYNPYNKTLACFKRLDSLYGGCEISRVTIQGSTIKFPKIRGAHTEI